MDIRIRKLSEIWVFLSDHSYRHVVVRRRVLFELKIDIRILIGECWWFTNVLGYSCWLIQGLHNCVLFCIEHLHFLFLVSFVRILNLESFKLRQYVRGVLFLGLKWMKVDFLTGLMRGLFYVRVLNIFLMCRANWCTDPAQQSIVLITGQLKQVLLKLLKSSIIHDHKVEHLFELFWAFGLIN